MKGCARCPGLAFEVQVHRARVALLTRAIASLGAWVETQTTEPTMPAIRALHATRNRLQDMAAETNERHAR